MNNFKKQKMEVIKLQEKYKEYLLSEYGRRDYLLYLSNPDNFVDGVYYHQSNSEEDKNNIIQKGFDLSRVRNSNCGVGRGFYLGRDKEALINFYSDNINNTKDFTLKVTGNFKFFNLMGCEDFLKKNSKNLEKKVLDMGYDGIRYYDPDSTGEEFVLFNLKKAVIWNT